MIFHTVTVHIYCDKVRKSAARKMSDPSIGALSVLTHFDCNLIISKRNHSFFASLSCNTWHDNHLIKV